MEEPQGTDSRNTLPGDVRSLSDLINDLACAAVQAQNILDENHRLNLETLGEFAPPRLQLTSHRIEFNLWCSSVRESGFSLGASLAGTLVNAFLAIQHHHEEKSHDRMVLEVELVPAHSSHQHG